FTALRICCWPSPARRRSSSRMRRRPARSRDPELATLPTRCSSATYVSRSSRSRLLASTWMAASSRLRWVEVLVVGMPLSRQRLGGADRIEPFRAPFAGLVQADIQHMRDLLDRGYTGLRARPQGE